jgi:hypothetical protein
MQRSAEEPAPELMHERAADQGMVPELALLFVERQTVIANVRSRTARSASGRRCGGAPAAAVLAIAGARIRFVRPQPPPNPPVRERNCPRANTVASKPFILGGSPYPNSFGQLFNISSCLNRESRISQLE